MLRISAAASLGIPVSAAAALPCPLAAEPVDTRPKLPLIVADDASHEDTGGFGGEINMPNTDARVAGT